MIYQKKKVIDDIQDSLTDDKIEQSASVREKNPYLLQEYEEQEAEEVNADADINAESNKIDEENNRMII